MKEGGATVKKLFSVFLFCCLALWGCAPQKDTSATCYVRLIYVQGTHEGQPITRQYMHPRKLDTILFYLRTLEDQALAKTDPERIVGDRYRITVVFSDGSKKIYYQQADRFLSRDARPWRQVDREKARLFYPLLKSLPPDQIPYIDMFQASEKPA